MAVPAAAIVRPRHMRNFVARARLTELVDEVDESRVTTLCAPAGYGKTTAMACWSDNLAQRGRPVLWLALRAGINSPADFAIALREAAAAAGLDCSHLPAGASIDAVLACCAATQQRPPVVIIDDAQLLAPELLAVVSAMVACERDSLTTIIASRSRRTLPVARLRSLGRLLEVGPADLRFSVADAALFITLNGNPAVDAALLQRLVDETKGWPSGIVMAGTMHRREWTFSQDGDHRASGLRRDFEDYFDEEVLCGQPDAIRTFLIETAVLDELTPAACAAVTQREDGRHMLEAVEDAGLFVEACDAERFSYRCHPLFRDMILRRLTDRDPARAATLHRRASGHYAACGDVLLAVDHARRSKDEAFLADQLDALAERLTYGGNISRLDEMGSGLPRSLLAGRPMLLLGLAWRRIRALAFSSAETLIAMAEDVLRTRLATDSTPDLETGHLARCIEHRRIMLLAARDDMFGLEQRAERLLVELGDADPYLSCTLLAQLMAARRELYHFHDTLKLEAETRRALQRPGSSFASIALKASIAPTLMAQGKVDAAETMLREALGLAGSLQGSGSGLAALPALPLAELLYNRNRLVEAGELVEMHLPVAREWGFVDQLAAGHVVRARLLASEGRLAEALQGLEQSHLLAIECGLERLRAVTVAEQVRLLIRNGRLQEAEAAFAAGDLKQTVEPFPTLRPTRQNESVAVAWIRLETHNHRLTRARKVAKRWSEFVGRTGAIRSAVVFELLLAEIAVLAGDRSEARRAAREAVAMAAPAGWIRVFLDEGDAIGTLLCEAYEKGPSLDTLPDRFAVSLVAAFQGRPSLTQTDTEGLDGRLVSRELDILTMVGGGLRNREIGDRLGLTEGTVKWYMQQIYDKLGVRRRPQAVMRARQLGVLA